MISAALERATDVLAERMLVTQPQLAGRISATLDPSCTLRAARALLHELVRSEKLAAIGALTERGEPYLALHRHDDREEIDRQLAYLRDQIDRHDAISVSNLLPPTRELTDESWAEILLAHAEFHCWGRHQKGYLVAWGAQGP